MQRAREVRPDGEFELDAYWWAPDRSERRAGTLTWTREKGADVKVLDLFPRGTLLPPDELASSEPSGAEEAGETTSVAWAPGPPDDLAVLHGETIEGVPCTLLEPVCRNWRSNNFRHSREIWSSNRLLHGVHVGAVDELVFKSASVELHGLLEWATKPTTEAAGALSTAAGEDRLEVDIPGGQLGITVVPALVGPRGQRRREVVATADFSLEQPTSLPAFHDRFLNPLQDLLLLATREPTPIGSVVVYLDPLPAFEPGPPFPPGRTIPRRVPSVQVVERVRMSWPRPRNRPHERMLFNLGAFGDQPSSFVERWYRLRADIGEAGTFFSGTLDEPHWDMNDRLFKLMNFAEAYHRGQLDEPPFESDVHSAMVDRMLSSLDTAEQRRVYRMRLDFANSQTQRERVEAVVGRAIEVVPELESLATKLSRGLTQTRNYVTHWGTRTEHVLDDAGDLYVALEQLTLVLQANLMRDLGLPDEFISEATRSSYAGEGVIPGS